MKVKGAARGIKSWNIGQIITNLGVLESQGTKLVTAISSLLSIYLTERGYKILFPDPKETVGAATLSLLTFKEISHGKPFKVFWTQRCHRPSDFRKVSQGINSWSRSSVHTQLQILGRPTWTIHEMREEAVKIILWLGLDPTKVSWHRDDWSGPCIGAYGRGLEIHYEGIEIMQATVFTSYAGTALDPQIHELVIGLERLIFCICKASNRKVSMIHYPAHDRYYFKKFKERDAFFQSQLIKFMRLSNLSRAPWSLIVRLNHLLNLILLKPTIDGLDRLYLLKRVQRLCQKVNSF